jgi:enediyne biosynthesis protein E4
MHSLPKSILFGICSIFCFQCKEKAEENEKTLFTKVEPSTSGVKFNNTIIEDDTSNMVDFYYVYNGAGVAIGDINNDDLPDLFFSGNQVSDRLYLNKGNFKFEDITAKAGIQKKGWSTGVTMADVNADGLLDIYVCKSGNFPAAERTNLLYINRGNLIFEEQASSWGLADTTHTNQAAFFDYDRDGDLDAYLMTSTNSIRNPNKLTQPKDDGTGSSVDRLFQNQGKKFVDVSTAAGILQDGFGLGLAIHDLNGDGWEDILVSNDFLANDHLYINNHNGTFTESAKLYFRHHSNFSMGNDVGDYNNDGLPDVVVVDMLPSDPVQRKKMAGPANPNAFEAMIRAGYHPQYMRNMLHLNLGKDDKQNPVFAEIGQQVGIHSTDWSWAPLFADFDHDGWRDLFITNGYLRDITDMDFIIHNGNVATSGKVSETSKVMRAGAVKMPSITKNNFLFRNTKDSGFTDVSKEWLGDHPSLSNGASVADLDNDGDLDIVTNNINESASIFRNNSSNTRYLKIKLVGPPGNTKGLGSDVTIYFQGAMQTQHMAVTRGYQSSVDYTLNFGLGENQEVNSLEVRWPDGKREIRTKIPANQVITLNYEDGSPGEVTLTKPEPLFLENISGSNGLDFVHKEEFYMDYDVEPLLPHKLSQQGPCLASADINGDGLEDFFVGGSYKHHGTIFIQNQKADFTRRPISQKADKQEEDTDAIFFDSDKDGDQDLYIVSGSNEFFDESKLYQDRLLVNDGRGNFSIRPNLLPVIGSSGGCVAAVDFDKDGDTDLFRGGRLIPMAYPKPGNSYLLLNDRGKFINVIDSLAAGLKNIGMVTDACWADVDGDTWYDLVLVGEYMPITIFRNDHGVLKQMNPSSLQRTNGLWNSVTVSDIDKDGDLDLIAGNLGLNSRYRFTKEKPLSVYCGDLDGNGSLDAIPAYYFGEVEYPVPPLFDLVRQIPMFKKRYQNFDTYARTTMTELIAPVKEKIDYVARAFEQRSVIIENLGNGEFNIRPLPDIAQRSPVTDVAIEDIDMDGSLDIILVGNDYSVEPIEGQHDAGVGIILLGDGKGEFIPLQPRQSAFWVEGDARKIITLNWRGNRIILVSQNKGQLLAFRKMNEKKFVDE